ncbi:YVTN family beta-propeller protein [Allocatelliglobosispora scoriae]|uniref:YVTN family beta-propeller protein n=1 Tax=Allocatelliglobosispora scoriae TaxID=643052 RepID=A0A841BPL6_9ACTN|nr:TIR domain-containing protein [Allocatelliglobosispora scoriae]MBB5868692.1 YVTN family beta-propeller protein [Allocatelliglobosispora scoriae]
MSYVFLSYGHGDAADYVERLAGWLGEAGVPIWYDKEIISGHRWSRVIQQRIEGCSAFIVVMTPQADQSEWVERELTLAESLGKPVLPMLLAGRPFFRLGNRQFEDVTDTALPGSAFLATVRSLAGVTPPAPLTVLGAAEPPPVQTAEPVPVQTAEPVPVQTAEPLSLRSGEPLSSARTGEPRQRQPSPGRPRLGTRRVRLLALTASAVAVVLVGSLLVRQFGRESDKPSAPPDTAAHGTTPALAISPDGRLLYVAITRMHITGGTRTLTTGSLVAVNTQAGTVIPNSHAENGGNGMSITSAPDDAAITADGKRLYLGRFTDPFLIRITALVPEPRGIGRGVDLGTTADPVEGVRSVALSPDGKRAYLADEPTATVSVVDTVTEKQVGNPITVGRAPRDLVMNPTGTRLFAAGSAASTVSVVDTATNEVIAAPAVGRGPRGLFIRGDGRRLYVANAEAGGVSIIDTGDNTVVTQFPAACGAHPIAVAVSDQGNRLHTICEDSDVVGVQDAGSGAALGSPTARTTRPARSMLLSPDGKRLYVAVVEAKTVTITMIDTTTNTAVMDPIVADTWLVDG